MRKLVLSILLLLFSTFTFAQDFESGDLNKRSYIRVGLSTPTYHYYGFSGKEDMENRIGLFLKSINEDFDNTTISGRIGANFEVGTIYPLNGINIADNLRLGINIDWLSIKAQVFNLEGSQNLYNGFAATKGGLALSYGLSKAIIFDVYGKVSMVWAGGIYYNHQNGDGNIDIFRGYLQPMYSTGVNVKLAFIILGFEYEFGSLRLKNNEGVYFGNVINDSNRTPMSGFNATFGFIF